MFSRAGALDGGPDARGLPNADPAVERWARRATALAALWMLAVGLWEIAGPVPSGHFAVVGARGIIADNMLRWGLVGPVRTYTLDAPPPALFYAHHPWGPFWIIAGLTRLLGLSEWVLRLSPVLMSVAAPLLCHATARALWSPVAGAAAAWGFACLPITLAYAQFPGFEIPVVTGCLLACWGGVRFFQTWRRRHLAVFLLGVLFALHADWESYVFVGLVLGATLPLFLFLPRRWFGPVDLRRFLTGWLLAVLVTLASLGLYAWLFQRHGHLDNLLFQGRARSQGNDLPLEQVLQARKHWIEIMFTPPAILLGKLAAPLVALRLLLLRRAAEVFPLAVLGMGLFHYLFFKNGADVHIYWPYPFAAWFALGFGAIGHTLFATLRWLLRARPAQRLAAPVSLGVGLLVPALVLPDGLRGLDWARATGGRLNDDGHLNLQDHDKLTFVRWLAGRLERRTIVGVHPSFASNWALEWTLRPRPLETAQRPRHDDPLRRYFFLDTRFASTADLRAVGEAHRVHALGSFWFVDAQEGRGELAGYSFEEREPNLLERAFVQAHDPVRRVRADPWITWEWRRALGQNVEDVPEPAAETREERRIAHNRALARGDRAAAARLREALLAELDGSVRVAFDDGTELLGRHFQPGAAPKLWLYFEAKAAVPAELQFDVRSVVEADARLSWVPRDDKEKKVGTFFVVPPRLWEPGFLYSYAVEIRRRPGRERFYGYWLLRGADPVAVPRPVGDPGPVTLLVLE